MELGFISFILVMFIKGSGLMGNPMVVGFILQATVASMLESSSGVLSMGLVSTNIETEMCMLVNTLLTRCMVLEFTNLATDTNMRDPGMKAEGMGLVFTLSENGKLNLVTGKMGFLLKLAAKPKCLTLPSQLILAKFLLLSRKQGKHLREHIR